MPRTRPRTFVPRAALLALTVSALIAAVPTARAAVSGQWVQLTSVGTPPTPRHGARAIYDSANQRIVLYGGQRIGAVDTVFDQVWVLTLGCNPQWSLLVHDSGPKRFDAAVAYDPVHGQLVVFGGQDEHGTSRGDTWTLSLGASPTWARDSSGGGPCPRTGVTGIWDPGTNQFAIFGGQAAPWGFYMSDTWEQSMTSPYGWSNPSGSPDCNSTLDNPTNVPDRRGYHVMIYDSANSRMLVHAGDYEGQIGDDVFTSSDDGANWSEMGNPHLSLPRMSHTGVYDAGRKRMIIFGGTQSEGGVGMNDAWELSLGAPGSEAWTQLSPSGTAPQARQEQAAAFDPVQDRMIVFGGLSNSGGNPDLNDTWMLSFDTTAPAAVTDLDFKGIGTSSVTLKWTAQGDDGTTGTACHYDVRWSTNAITDDASFAAATQAPNPPTPSPSGSQDTLKITGMPRNEWLYFAIKIADEAGNWSALSNVPCILLGNPDRLCDGGFAMRPLLPSAAPTFSLDAIHPNPAPARTTVEFTLPSSDPATLELIDLAGRRVWSTEVGGLGAGPHALDLGGPGRPLTPGFYFVRLRGEREASTRSVVITR